MIISLMCMPYLAFLAKLAIVYYDEMKNIMARVLRTSSLSFVTTRGQCTSIASAVEVA